MDITSILPLDILMEIGMMIEKYSDYVSYISTCKKINSIDKDVRRIQTNLHTKHNSELTSWDDGKSLSFSYSEILFKGVANGPWCRQVGLVTNKGYYRHNIPDGERISYIESIDEKEEPRITLRCKYFNGKIHGRYESWSLTSSSKNVDCNYDNGLVIGICEASRIYNTSLFNSPYNLFKYEKGVCISICTNPERVEVYEWLKEEVENIDFDYVIPNSTGYIYDMYFEKDGFKWIIEFDTVDESEDNLVLDPRINHKGLIRAKTMEAIEHGYRIIRIASSPNKLLDSVMDYITWVITTSKTFQSNMKNLYKFVSDNHIDLDFSLSNTCIPHSVSKDNRYVKNMYRACRPDKYSFYDQLSPQTKEFISNYVEYLQEVMNVITIRDHLINEIKTKKILNTSIDDDDDIEQFIHTNTSLIYYCLFHSGGFLNDTNDMNLSATLETSTLRRIEDLCNDTNENEDNPYKHDDDFLKTTNSCMDSFIRLLSHQYTLELDNLSCDPTWDLDMCMGLTENDINLFSKFAGIYLEFLKKFLRVVDNLHKDSINDYKEYLECFTRSTSYISNLLTIK